MPMNRRGFLTGLLAAPVVIRTPGLLMPVRAVDVRPLTLEAIQAMAALVDEYNAKIRATTRYHLIPLEMRDRLMNAVPTRRSNPLQPSNRRSG